MFGHEVARGRRPIGILSLSPEVVLKLDGFKPSSSERLASGKIEIGSDSLGAMRMVAMRRSAETTGSYLAGGDHQLIRLVRISRAAFELDGLNHSSHP